MIVMEPVPDRVLPVSRAHSTYRDDSTAVELEGFYDEVNLR